MINLVQTITYNSIKATLNIDKRNSTFKKQFVEYIQRNSHFLCLSNNWFCLFKMNFKTKLKVWNKKRLKRDDSIRSKL